MNHAFKATAHENKIRRWQTFTPPQNTALAAFCGLFSLRRSYERFTDSLAQEFRVFLNERLIATEVGVIERPQNLSNLEVPGSFLSFFNFSTNLVRFHRCPSVNLRL
jgi:hypothetical protein